MISHRHIFYILFTFSLSLLTAIITLYSSDKLIAVFVLILALALLFFQSTPFVKLILPLVLITFPINIQVFGKDAFSTGTLAIFAIFIWSISRYKLNKTIHQNKSVFVILILILGIGFIGMVTKTPLAYAGPAVRHYINLISSIALFFLIVHSQNFKDFSQIGNDYLEKIISTLITIVLFHIFLSFLILNFPWLGKYLAIFLTRAEENFAITISRAQTVFTGGEEFGELLILMFPFVIYKLFSSKGKKHIVIVLLYIFGIIISGTRSALILTFIQLFIFTLVFVPEKYKQKKINIVLVFLVASPLLLPVLYKFGPIVLDRMLETIEQVSERKDIYTISNRDLVWPIAYKITTSTLSLFGHGPVQAHIIGFPSYNFHNLYLSLIFQFGIVGTAIFSIFFLLLVKRLYFASKKLWSEKNTLYLLPISCLLSLICFLINEVKFEFNRADSYQQIVWSIFAIFYLAGNTYKNEKEKKTYHH